LNTSYQIREIGLTELLKLRRLFKKALRLDFSYFPAQYLRQVSRQNTAFKLLKAWFNPRRVLIGAWHQHKLVGYVIGDVTSQQLGQIFWLFVLPDYRGIKIGRHLLSEALQFFRYRKVSQVKLITHRYKHFYLSQNFYEEKFCPKLIGNIDMYQMTIDLD